MLAIESLAPQVAFITRDNAHYAAEYYDRLHDDGLTSQAFPDGTIRNRASFVSMVYDDINHVYLVWWEGQLAAHVNLNGWHGKIAQGHFSILKQFHGPTAIAIGRYTARTLFHPDYLRTLVGMTPVNNRLARRFNKQIGWKEHHIFPEAFKLASGECVDAVMSILTPETISDV